MLAAALRWARACKASRGPENRGTGRWAVVRPRTAAPRACVSTLRGGRTCCACLIHCLACRGAQELLACAPGKLGACRWMRGCAPARATLYSHCFLVRAGFVFRCEWEWHTLLLLAAVRAAAARAEQLGCDVCGLTRAPMEGGGSTATTWFMCGVVREHNGCVYAHMAACSGDRRCWLAPCWIPTAHVTGAGIEGGSGAPPVFALRVGG